MTKKEEKAIKDAVNEIEYRKQASAAFVDGIISLFILHFIFGIIAIVRANLALKSKDEETITKAKNGRTLGIIGIALPIVFGMFYLALTVGR